MKKYILGLLIIPFLYNCKKGQDDPAISLRTRKSRVVGEWSMKKGTAGITITEPGKALFNQTFTLDGTKANINETEEGMTQITYIMNYSFFIYFYKDGKFKANENFGGAILEATGTWNFLGGVGESKNKESIVLNIDKVDKGYTGNNLFNQTNTQIVYKILELRNKKMTINASTKPYIDAKGKYANFSCEYTLEQR